jgi:hypothetical protein
MDLSVITTPFEINIKTYTYVLIKLNTFPKYIELNVKFIAVTLIQRDKAIIQPIRYPTFIHYGSTLALNVHETNVEK